MSPAFRSSRATSIQSLEPRILLWSFDIFGWEYDSDWFKDWNTGSGGSDYVAPPPPEGSLATTKAQQRAAFDRLGNAFVAGVLEQSSGDKVDVDPGEGQTGLAGADGQVFLARYTPRGVLSWARQFGSGGSGMTVSAMERDTEGNLLLCGSFTGNPDFDPSEKVYTVAGKQDPNLNPYAYLYWYAPYGNYVAKYSPSGDLIWARACDGTVNGLAADRQGNILLTGTFTGTADLAPGSEVRDLVARGSRDIFVSKLSRNGRLTWAVQLGGSSVDETNQDAGMDVATDAAGNAYITGVFGGTADFNPGRKVSNLTSVGREDAFFVCLGPQAQLKWAKQSGGEFDDAGFRIATSPTGALFAAGMSGTDAFNASLNTFVTRIAASSGITEWTAPFTGARLADLSIASDTSVYTTGEFTTTDFDPGEAVHSLSTSTVVGSGFVSHLSSKGADLGAAQFGTDGGVTRGCAVNEDASGRVNLLALIPVPWQNKQTTLPTATFARKLLSSEWGSEEPLTLLQIDSIAYERQRLSRLKPSM